MVEDGGVVEIGPSAGSEETFCRGKEKWRRRERMREADEKRGDWVECFFVDCAFFPSSPRCLVPVPAGKLKPRGKSDLVVSQAMGFPNPIRIRLVTKRNGKRKATLGACGHRKASLLWLLNLTAPHLLSLEVLIQQEQGRFIRFGCAHDCEHSFTRLVVRSLQRSNQTVSRGKGRHARLTLAIDIRAPDVFRISLILLPARPMMQPTMSAGILMFWV